MISADMDVKAMLKKSKQYFRVGGLVYVFDEKETMKHARIIKKSRPIRAHVSKVSDDHKTVTIVFDETRPWYEAAGYWVHKGQDMNFYFDDLTLRWLREGLTAETVRSIDDTGKSVYFQISNTRQYLLFPYELYT